MTGRAFRHGMIRWLIVLLLAGCTASHPSIRGSPHASDEGVSSSAGDGAESEPNPEARELSQAATASIERNDPEAGPRAAAELAKRHGGWVATMRECEVTVAVPGDQLDAVLAELPSLGKVAESRLLARDVTAAHRDLEVRIDSLRRERERYLALLDRAAGVAEALQVEHEIERLTSQLELLEAQLSSLKDRVADAALAISFSREVHPGPVGYVFYAVYTGIKWLFVRD
jgi:hypothetical protein